MKYIKLGEKKDGKYIKAEELTLEKFSSMLTKLTPRPEEYKKKWNELFTKEAKIKNETNKAYIRGYKEAHRDLILTITYIINKDKKGKKE